MWTLILIICTGTLCDSVEMRPASTLSTCKSIAESYSQKEEIKAAYCKTNDGEKIILYKNFSRIGDWLVLTGTEM